MTDTDLVDAAGALSARLRGTLAAATAAQRYRVRRVVAGGHGVSILVDGRECLNFCSNDYLGLAADPRLASAAQQALGQSGTGSGAAALVSGYNREHQALEEEIAAWLGRPRALLFSTGWAANLGVLRGLLGRSDTLVADELNHASLIDGGRLAGCEYKRVAHVDVDAYERALSAAPVDARASDGLTLVCTDGIFSMDGDLAPVPALAALARRHGSALMVDDAHGLGVLGAAGRGTLDHLAAQAAADFQPEQVDIHVATLGKSIGAAGAFVAGSDDLIEYLIQRARSWVFSTAPPPAIAAAARAGVRIVAGPEGDERRRALLANVARFRAACAREGIALGASETPIQPLLLGEEGRALRLSQTLLRRGFWVAAIRPPTVPPGTARLRITFSAAHQPAQIDALVEALAEGLRADSVAAP